MLRIFALSALLFITASHAQKLPLENFTAMPMVQRPVISPDGKHIAAIVNVGDQTQVMIAPFGSHKLTPLLSLGGEKFRMEYVRWANNNRVLAIVSQPYNHEGLKLRTTHMFAANIDGSNVIELRRSKKARRSTSTSELDFYRNSPNLVSLLPKDPEHILVKTRDPRDGNFSSIYKVNVNTGEHEKYLANSRRILNWVVNGSGDVQVAIGAGGHPNDHKLYFYARKDNKDSWQLIYQREPYKGAYFLPEFYDEKTNSLLVLSNRELGKRALWRFDLNTKEFTELVAQAPGEYDIEDLIFKNRKNSQEVVGYTYFDHFQRRVYFDKQEGELDKQLSAALKQSGLQSHIADYDDSKTKFIISAVSDSSPTKYFTFDLSTKKLNLWFSQYPNLESKSLANVTPFEFTASDKVKLNGYLTLPKNIEKPPLVVFPHGGPYARDYQYFDPFVQMMANEGFAVLQVNFRGSTGFGSHYVVRGYQEWGKAMQQDLYDAIDWVKSTELVNTNKMCIAGASYGGYAALVAGFQKPKDFKCIASIAGISSLSDQITKWRRTNGKLYVENAVGDDMEQVENYSPINFVKKYESPVLLVHGRVDTRVGFRQSTGMYDALKQAGKQVEYHELDFGTHFLDDASNRKHAMEQLSLFLQKHLN